MGANAKFKELKADKTLNLVSDLVGDNKATGFIVGVRVFVVVVGVMGALSTWVLTSCCCDRFRSLDGGVWLFVRTFGLRTAWSRVVGDRAAIFSRRSAMRLHRCSLRRLARRIAISAAHRLCGAHAESREADDSHPSN